jgi:phospholipid/cholesterol/gamma-HCH transport system ATP-binding protein
MCSATDAPEARIAVEKLTIGYDGEVIQRDLSFAVRRGEVFLIMGGSGSGKSTLLRHLIGLMPPIGGEIRYDGVRFTGAPPDEQQRLMRRFGVLYQRGALWSALTLAENVALPLQTYTRLPPQAIQELVEFKLALVGLADFADHYPAQLSGGMQKRAGLARAMALDPDILFFDEPSAGLDPVTARRLDDLILELRDSLGTTIVVVTHDLASIFAIGDTAVFLDGEARTITATGDPHQLKDAGPPAVRAFLTRGEPKRREDT